MLVEVRDEGSFDTVVADSWSRVTKLLLDHTPDLLSHNFVHHFSCQARDWVEGIFSFGNSLLGPVTHVIVDQSVDRLINYLSEHLLHHVVKDSSLSCDESASFVHVDLSLFREVL